VSNDTSDTILKGSDQLFKPGDPMLICLLFLRFSPPLPPISGTRGIFQQKLDHFNRSDDESFDQIYFVNNGHVKGAISRLILYIQTEVSSDFASSLPVLAAQSGASLIGLQHRYYGESIPTDSTTTNLAKYLTIRQSLADIAQFLSDFRSVNCTADCQIVVAGGAYSGTIASYFRQLYPHLTNFSLVSSSPLFLSNDFPQLDDDVYNSLNSVSSICLSNSIELLKNLRARDPSSLKTLLGLIDSTHDLSPLAMVGQYFIELAQNSSTHNSEEVINYCRSQSGDNFNESAFLVHFRAAYPDPNAEDYYQQTVTSPKLPGIWQQCSEIGLFPASVNSPTHFLVNLSYFEDVCRHLFDISLPDPAANRNRFGGSRPDTTNIVFVNGMNDSYSAIGVGFDATVSSRREVVIRYRTGSYCADLFVEKSTDAADLRDARRFAFGNVTQWFANCSADSCQHGHCELGQCVCDADYEGQNCDARTMPERMVNLFSTIFVLLPMTMMIVIGCAAWFLFVQEMNEAEADGRISRVK
jgi:hypothetical protein